jgi:hypothetical protein
MSGREPRDSDRLVTIVVGVALAVVLVLFVYWIVHTWL